MATKIRLQRGGRKSYAFYSIVIADVRAPRDGKFTEKIGTFNPNTNPATVDLNFDRALYWVETGAQPTDTVRNILKGEGVYLMKHLRGGVKKGAFDEAEAQKRFDAWKNGKDAKASAVRENEAKAKKDAAAKELEAEKKVNEAIAKKVADKKAAATLHCLFRRERANDRTCSQSCTASRHFRHHRNFAQCLSCCGIDFIHQAQHTDLLD